MKIYTGKGDDGKTAGSLAGERVAKSHVRIDIFGNIDELNSGLGMLRALLPKEAVGLNDEIMRIQSHLLQASALIAAWQGSAIPQRFEEIGDEHVRFLETAIDRIDKILPGLANFIIPGDHPLPALVHVTRTVCRRAERDVIRLSSQAQEGNPPEQIQGMIIYLNRLSDYLFVVGRYCNYLLGEPEDAQWKK
jgi:cob(I)alamin adenosyltransferase